MEIASVDPGSPEGPVGIPSGHGGSPTARKTGGELSEGGRYTVAIRYVIELSSREQRLLEGVGIALAGEFKVNKNALAKC